MKNCPPEVQQQLMRLKSGIDILKDKIIHATDLEERRTYFDRANELMKKYRILRSEYDVIYFAYEYFSDEKNPENENNLMPLGCTVENAPDFHHELSSKLDELNDNVTAKIGWSVPRGHAKSAYLSNVFPTHQIVFKKRKYILVISETTSMAQKFIEWVGTQLKHNKKLRDDFGDLLSPNKQANEVDNLEGFVTHTGIKVQAAGMGVQLRGARHGAYRPDLLILDDLESSKNTNTKELREKNLHWFNSVIMPIGDITRTAFIYMGTLVHGQGLLTSVLNRSDFSGRIYSAIVSEPDRVDLWTKYEDILRNVDDMDREANADLFYYENREEMDKGALTLWNSRFPYKELIKIKVNVGSKSFASEYLNKPSDSDSCIFNKEYFTFYNEHELISNKFQNLDIYSFWDIAVGKNKRSDYNAIVTIGRDRTTGVVYVIDSWAEKIPMHKALEVALRKIQQFRPKVFGVETIQAQYDMFRQLRENCMKHGLYSTRILAVNPTAKKEDRIEMLEPLIESGYIRLNRGHRLLLEQLELFPAIDHDDSIDALASVINMAGTQRRRSFHRKPKGF